MDELTALNEKLASLRFGGERFGEDDSKSSVFFMFFYRFRSMIFGGWKVGRFVFFNDFDVVLADLSFSLDCFQPLGLLCFFVS